MKFEHWLREQANRDDRVGDLARDYVEDCCRNNIERSADSLRRLVHGLSEAAFEQAMGEYQTAVLFE